MATGLGGGQVVEVVAGLDDFAVAYPEYEDRWHCERFAGVGVGSSILELGDDDLGVGCFVDCDVGRSAAQAGSRVGWCEVLAQFVAGAQGGLSEWVERVHDVGLFRIEAWQFVPSAVRDTVDQRKEDISWAWHGLLLSRG